ncbi:MAG: NAD-dependent epimerase/dehydratase family protein [Sphingobacteriaceae bacterium]|nr:NAD-dependent epimerase/dehydratase family protein [Sphingobacteriaceae bacterium]
MNAIIAKDIQSIIQDFKHWKRFANKTVLISGANGFLPAYLVEALMALDKNYNTKVIALVRNRAKAEQRFSHLLNNSQFQLLIQDVSKPFQISEPIDFIVHAASQASPKYYGTDPVGTLSANLQGTLNLIELAKEKKCESFLFFSSGEVYGEVKNEDIPIQEDTFGYLNPVKVRSCYGESKRMGENICVSYHAQYGVPAKIVRPFHTYGPGMMLDDGRVFADFVAHVVRKENIVLHSDGSAIRPFCYLSDATLAFLLILTEGVNGEAYNMGNPNEEHSVLNLANIITGIYPELGLKVELKIKAADNSYLKSPIVRNSPNIDKIQKLGWTPKVGVKEGFKRTIDSFLVTEKTKT